MGFIQKWADGFKPAETSGFGRDPSYGGEFDEQVDQKPEVLGDGEFANAITTVQTADGGVAYVPEKTPLKRRLDGRHIQFIALGGGIGTGLFIGSASSLSTAGPAFLIVDFIIMGLMLMCVIFALGELACVLPVSGAFSTYASRFVDPAWGFAAGWNYYLQWLIVAPLEFTAATIVIKFWDKNEVVPKGVWVTIFILVITTINLFGVRGYAEFEFVATFIKVITVIGLIFALIVIDCGGVVGGPGYIGAHVWHDPGAITNGFKGFCTVFTNAAFAFAGSELVGLAAAETKTPRKVLPKAARQIVFRIVIFYVLSLFLVSLIVPYDDPRLTSETGQSYDPNTSPFVIALQIGRIKGLPHIVNAVIIISTLSVANSAVYASSRTLLALAEQNFAPRIFRFVDREGRPLPATILSLLFCLLAFLIYSASEGTIFGWMLQISGLSTIFTWANVCISHIRFRMAWKHQGHTLRELPWASPLGIIGSVVGLVMNIIVIAANIYVGAAPIGEGEESPKDRAYDFFNANISLLVLIFSFICYKLIMRTRFVRLEDIDIHTGRRDPVSEEVLEQERAEARARPLWKKIVRSVF
ncbi:hypothetical protein MPSI1_003385 [Malassezia psittaci]|uniref:Amino acid permease/ SLC12A domain-containing protein n=1 Tax=Malassezia psittaci TaxID=1821823 RepID=A0AAF0JFH8_9BASI|nr:hypothetical protein MPSI1_003385 [Malassezia psittaci]